MKRLDFLWTLLFMAFIGALIGGFTNHLAIKMLFRPHEAKYIGKWRLPFTPGLIPKRRDELAIQLGKTVTNYLLTPETFRKKLLTNDMEKKAEHFLQQKLEEHILHSEKTLNDWLVIAGATNVAGKVEQKVLEVLDAQLSAVREKLTSRSVEEVLPEKWRSEAEERIPAVTTYILSKSEHYFASEEGKAMFRKLIDDFLASKGTLGSMVNMFFGESESLVGKVQREALKFVAAPGTFDLVNSLLEMSGKGCKNGLLRNYLQASTGTDCSGRLKCMQKKNLQWKVVWTRRSVIIGRKGRTGQPSMLRRNWSALHLIKRNTNWRNHLEN